MKKHTFLAGKATRSFVKTATYCLWWAVGALSASFGQSATELLDKAIRHPGIYGQVCDLRMLPSPAPIPGFRLILQGEAMLSEVTLEALKAQKAELAPIIIQRLSALELFTKPQNQPLDPAIKKDEEGNYESDSDPRGYDPKVYNLLLLRIIQDLEMVEAIPALLAFEERFYAAVKRAEKDKTAPLPTVHGAEAAAVAMEGLYNDETGKPVEYDTLTDAQKEEFVRKGLVFNLVVAQRDILAVIVRFMRKEGYQPLLNSPFEAEYGRLLRERWGQHRQLKNYKKPEDIPEEEQEDVKFDPIHGLAYEVWDPVKVPYTEEKRAFIRELAAKFVESRTAPK